MKKQFLGVVTLLSAFVLAACGGGNGDNNNDSADGEGVDLAIQTDNDDEAIDGGSLNVAVVMDTQFQGLFQREFYQDSYDNDFMEPSHEELFLMDEDMRMVDGGAANYELDEENKTGTVTLNEDLTWSDGEDVTADDYIFTHEVIGDPDYTGVRYGEDFTNIVGMDEYHAGDADEISGIEKVDDKTVTIEYKEVHPGLLQLSESVWSSALPKHDLEDIPVDEMESSDQVRKHPLSFGPYQMTNIVAGESVEYEPNEYYYGEAPKLDKLTFTVQPTDSAVESLNSKEYDLFLKMPTDNYSSYEDAEDYQMLGRDELGYNYLGFKLGEWDEDEGRVQYDPDAKMADKSLRQAMGYAIDSDAIGEKYYHGLRTDANSPIIPLFENFHDDDLEGIDYDIDKASELLDDAGYEDVDGDGIREDPDGEELTINYAVMFGGETAQPLADYNIQQWEEIGLNVELTTGRLIDFQAFYDKLENDDPDIDVYDAAWGVSSDPSPSGLFGPAEPFNYTRFESDENTELLNAIDSEASLDQDTQIENLYDWQEYVADEAYIVPTLFREEVLPVSNRVKDFDWSYDIDHSRWASVSVTSEDR
ncbi:oligopeptide ABC transporter substrate-binding protein [Tetragenococcus koreensis]|uniref:oligopeptide ABC transporter substrate-binding protein n=1 Tax=Tetragenococcus koreensis TaxID=290335 RepID=UPI001F46A2C4|nr:oligopeptide ABC transporter substrate-binding protein [Tetragenococcus koreensis]MCF1585361.1 oligopeptide ABC transporter substrate-binding protein [Tetragenococcus koreensis]MCF1614938.1 oligopeptide ABC transporter substrate-binding protein [Tetragenococcus koreensis]MCF1619081.1 oligopeptide ABC transporter substrate-binding protein [Tetragenococcus koreensis]MCF1624735.1 oligopeptide ABC transporter substrate-binding protein [Tetragenococcus koreensis]MCF1629626.1 oligopeptide ABC tra